MVVALACAKARVNGIQWPTPRTVQPKYLQHLIATGDSLQKRFCCATIELAYL
jgi:hypothetical protein